MTVRDPLADVARAQSLVTQATANLRAVEAARGVAIRAALDAGVSVTAIREATGLSRSRVYQVRHGTR